MGCTPTTGCGDDTSLCCGIALNGLVVGDDPTKPTGITMPNLAICNKKPDSDGTKLSVDFEGTLTGAGADALAVKFLYSKADFECFATPAPPTPTPGNIPAPVNKDAKVGVTCTKSADCGNADGSSLYCCGMATGGKLIDSSGKVVDSTSAANVATCNYNKAAADKDHPAAVSEQLGYLNPAGAQVTMEYPASGFTCFD